MALQRIDPEDWRRFWKRQRRVERARLRSMGGGILRPLLIAVAAGLIVAALATWLGLR
jgi:hypothetical protein